MKIRFDVGGELESGHAFRCPLLIMPCISFSIVFIHPGWLRYIRLLEIEVLMSKTAFSALLISILFCGRSIGYVARDGMQVAEWINIKYMFVPTADYGYGFKWLL